MHLCIHRGTKQIGGTCVELVSGGKRILLDLGLPLDAESNHSSYLPNVQGLQGGDDSLMGVLVSHPHMDHSGLLPHINENIPVHMGGDARRIMETAAPFLPGGRVLKTDGINFKNGESFTLGPFTITPYLVDHSAYDSYALLVEAEGKRIFYSGDFRSHGRKGKLIERLILSPPVDIDILLMEGSSLGRLDMEESFPSEHDMEEEFTGAFRENTGPVLVHTSSQNIDRIVTIYRACVKIGRTMIMDLYTAAVLDAIGNKHIPQSHWDNVRLYVPQAQRVQIKENGWFDLLKKHSSNRIFIETLADISENSVLLFRPLHIPDLDRVSGHERTLYIYSQWDGYWESPSYSRLRDWLDKNRIRTMHIHTSGHASPGDLKRFARALNPRKLVPIHTFMPGRYSELFDNVEYFNDGEYREV